MVGITGFRVAHSADQLEDDEILLLGRESAGVPDDVREEADARVIIPMADGQRSLNVVTSAAIALWEACRQTGSGPVAPSGG